MKTAIVIPAHNEAKHIQKVIREVQEYIPNIIVVDDGSVDDTYMLAKQEGVTVLQNIINVGKGATLRTGCDYAYTQGYDAIIAIDGDGQHDPRHIPQFLHQIDKHDIVFGYRTICSTMPAILRFGNWFINKSAGFLFGIRLKDTQCGYRAYKTSAYNKIRWDASDYSMESEMICNAGKHNVTYSEVPIQTIYSDKYKGTTVLDGIKIVLKMVWWKLAC